MQHHRLISLFAVAALSAPLCGQEIKRTYAVRMDGRVVGHMTETERPTTEDGRAVVRYQMKTLVKVELLGAAVDQHVAQTWILAADTRQPLRFTSVHETGGTKIALAGRLVEAGFQLDDGGSPLDPKVVVIAPDLLWLEERGPTKAGETVETDYLMPEIGAVQRVRVALAAEPKRTIDVMGTATPVVVYEMTVQALGIETVVFVRSDDYEIVRYEIPAQKMVMERVPPAVVERIERIDLTENILVKTDLDYEDPSRLTFVRVRADIQATKDVTVKSLNVPGQSFEGTVEDGRVVGVFSIRPRRIAGAGATPFPVPEGAFAASHLKAYLAPEHDIESDDPGIAGKARELAAGATSCFEVVERLGRWAHDEIPYVIPGGGSAKRTFEQRAGECAGHSRVLAAMLRSLGIPARTPMGGMYVPLYGGSFGQHMWTEVWLGDVIGWLAVDCTAGQWTYIDAGHIRLSDSVTSFAPKSIDVLDHEPRVAKDTEPASGRRIDAFPYAVGEALEYTWTMGGNALGEESITYRGIVDGAHVFDGSVNLRDGVFTESTRTTVGPDGRLLSFHAERTVGPLRETIDVTVADGKATVAKKSTEGDRSDSVAVDPSVFALHNNCTSHFALAVNRAGPLVEGAEHKIRFFHTEQRSTLPMTIAVKGCEEILIGGARVTSRIVEASLVGLSIGLHLDDQGRVLRYHQRQGDVRIELKKL